MVTITDEELLEKARVLYKKLGGIGSQDARLVRALIERAGLGRQPTPRAADGEEPVRLNFTITDDDVKRTEELFPHLRRR